MIYDAKTGTDQYIAKGTWNLSGTTLTTNVVNIYTSAGAPTGVSQTSTSTFDNTTGKLNTGIWQNAGASATGTFTLTRVN
ncbi:MAG: hypothetical protein ABI741_10190 [Ferruginibacter sp.]